MVESGKELYKWEELTPYVIDLKPLEESDYSKAEMQAEREKLAAEVERMNSNFINNNRNLQKGTLAGKVCYYTLTDHA